MTETTPEFVLSLIEPVPDYSYGDSWGVDCFHRMSEQLYAAVPRDIVYATFTVDRVAALPEQLYNNVEVVFFAFLAMATLGYALAACRARTPPTVAVVAEPLDKV